jgi:sulfur carrier protein
MQIKINGELVSLQENLTLKEIISFYLKKEEPKGIAAALNQKVIPKSMWNTTYLKENDNIEIVHAVQGG